MRPSTRRAVLVGTSVLVALPILVAMISDLHTLRFAVGDQAIIQLQADDIPGRIPLVGVYSRLGFHHPGPLLYLIAAPAVRLFGGPGLVVTAAVVAVACLCGLLFVLHRRGGMLLFVLGVVLAVVLTRSMSLDVLSMWNPYVLIVPFALSVALTWSVWCRDWRALPWLALVGSFVAQAHLGLAPAMAFLFGSAIFVVVMSGIRSRRSAPASTGGSPRPPRLALISAAVLLIVWLPPIIEQLTVDPGNLSSILDAGSSSRNGPRLGLGRGLGLLGLLLGRVDPLRFNSVGDLRILSSVHDGSGWWIILPLAALAATALLALRWRLHDQLRLAGLLFGLLLVSALALASISGLPYLYLERWLVVLSAFIWLALVWTVLCVLRLRLDQRRSTSASTADRRRMILTASFGLGALLVVALIPLAETPGHANDAVGSEAVAALIGPSRAGIGGCGLVGIAPIGGPEGLLVASGLLAQLHHDGSDVAVDDLFAFSHGEQHALRGRTPDCTLLVRAGPADAAGPVDGARQLGRVTIEHGDPGASTVYEVFLQQPG